MLMSAATVVQQLCKSCRTCCRFSCMFYFTCDRSFSWNRLAADWLIRQLLRNASLGCEVRKVAMKETNSSQALNGTRVSQLLIGDDELPVWWSPSPSWRATLRRHGQDAMVTGPPHTPPVNCPPRSTISPIVHLSLHMKVKVKVVNLRLCVTLHCETQLRAIWDVTCHMGSPATRHNWTRPTLGPNAQP